MATFQIIKCLGLGVMESRYTYYPTDLFYSDEKLAKDKAKKLLEEVTTKEERDSGWCGIDFLVEEVKIIK